MGKTLIPKLHQKAVSRDSGVSRENSSEGWFYFAQRAARGMVGGVLRQLSPTHVTNSLTVTFGMPSGGEMVNDVE